MINVNRVQCVFIEGYDFVAYCFATEHAGIYQVYIIAPGGEQRESRLTTLDRVDNILYNAQAAETSDTLR